MCARRTDFGPFFSGWTSSPPAASRSPRSSQDHWRTYGRDYYTRHDYEAISAAVGDQLIHDLRAKLETLPGRTFAGLTVV